jgi:hypothetical protein
MDWLQRLMDWLLRLLIARLIRRGNLCLTSARGTAITARQNMMVFQLQLTKRQGTVPIARDYLGVEEARLRASKAGAACRCGSPANDNAAIRREAAARVVDSSPPHYQSAIVKVDLPTYQEQIRRR